MAVEVEVTGSGPRAVDRALFALKKKCWREGLFAALERHRAYVKPSAARKRKRGRNQARLAKSLRRQQAAIARWPVES
jgi:ribosomal protein S21